MGEAVHPEVWQLPRRFAILPVLPKSSVISHTTSCEEAVDDSIAVDAKRILLRYGAPIVALDNVPE